MSRLFAFGCSFTNFHWPTWADILGLEFDYYENWGRMGSGNHYILYSLMECISLHNINKDDTVAIMWSTPDREDRFVDGNWLGRGNVHRGYARDDFGDDFVNRFGNYDHYYLTTYALVKAARLALDCIGCTYHMMAMESLTDETVCTANDIDPNVSRDSIIKARSIELYKDELALIKPSVHEVIFNSDWWSRPLVNHNALNRALEHFEGSYNNIKGKDWPSFEEFTNGDYLDYPKHIVDEICNEYELDLEYKCITSIRADLHPVPSEHLEYLEKVGFSISEHQRSTALEWDKITLAGGEINLKTLRNKVNRIKNQQLSGADKG